MTKTLFVIEAPGKIRSFESILQKIGLDAKVQATSGHLYESPKELSDLGVDSRFRETKRTARNDKTIWYMRQAAKEAEQVIIATDADTEGDVIAWDVYELLKDIHPDMLRVKLRGMDPDSVQESLTDAYPVRKTDAVPGRTRAIVDRLIGHSFSKNGVGVGRVSTSLLGLLHKAGPDISTTRVRLVAPAKDGSQPWVAQCDCNRVISMEIAERLAGLSLPALEMRAAKESSNAAMHMGEVMVRSGDELGMKPKETAKSLQNMYETGQMSYPRSGSKGVSKGAQRRLARMIRKSGFRGASERIQEKGDEDTHDAPYPIGDVDVSKDPRKLGDDQGVRALVAREFVKSSLKREKQIAFAKPIYEFLKSEGFSEAVAQHVARLAWTREIGPRFPGETSWPESGVVQRMPETVLLEKAMEAGLGRPSTWAKHIDGFMERGLADENLQLTEKGKAWVAGSPQDLLDPRISRAIEGACERIVAGMMDDPEREPWSVLAEKITSALPPEISQAMQGALEMARREAIPGYADDIARIDPPEAKEPELGQPPAPAPPPSDAA